MMQEISESNFISQFAEMNRENQFTYKGKEALYNYLIDLEDDINEKIELDIIALCCEYSEYKELNEYLKDYSPDVEREDFESEEEYLNEVEEWINNNTTLIKFGDDLDDGFIIQQY